MGLPRVGFEPPAADVPTVSDLPDWQLLELSAYLDPVDEV